jgi:5-methylcytosine-specific restriction enzyme A
MGDPVTLVERLTPHGRGLTLHKVGKRYEWRFADGSLWNGEVIVVLRVGDAWRANVLAPMKRIGKPVSFTDTHSWAGKLKCHGHDSKEAALACAVKAIPDHRRYAEREREEWATYDRQRARERRSRRAERVGPGWHDVRRMVLLEEPECRVCGAPSTQVDHIIPVSQGGSSQRDNLQGLCAPCHKAKSDAEQNARWEPWRQWREARTPPPGMDLIHLPEVARRLGIQYATARRWVSKGNFPPVEVVPGKAPVEWWRWNVVEAWARQTGRR